jgi:hypothetical protein
LICVPHCARLNFILTLSNGFNYLWGLETRCAGLYTFYMGVNKSMYSHSEVEACQEIKPTAEFSNDVKGQIP